MVRTPPPRRALAAGDALSLSRALAVPPAPGPAPRPRDATRYPRLSQWYDAMESQIPAYGCRVRGNAASWAKVLSQAGFGNGGSVPETSPDSRTAASDAAASARGAETWAAYAADRPWVAPSPDEEAAATSSTADPVAGPKLTDGGDEDTEMAT